MLPKVISVDEMKKGTGKETTLSLLEGSIFVLEP